ncbi:MAG TPA: hypothetical protein VJT67_05565 [Longimicrobiaceae bacterium]|nr:hypothetical protein [Longimicrobiaceae bacterium]
MSRRLRSILGIVAGVLMVLSSALHSFGGWPAMRTSLAKVNAPADLVQGVGIGWNWGGVAILTFGCIVLVTFVRALRGENVDLLPARIIAVAYTLFGAAAVLMTDNPFFVVFIVPGALLGMATYGPATGEW